MASELTELAKEKPSERIAKVATLLAVLTTLAAAMSAYFLNVASNRGGDAALEAQLLGIQSTSGLFSEQREAQLDFSTFVLAEKHRTQAATAYQSGFFSDDPKFGLEQARWFAISRRTQEMTTLTIEDREKDPTFPNRFFLEAGQESRRLSALQDAKNEESGAWSSRRSTYTAILTMLAVALYLFGLSGALKHRVRKLFLIMAIGLLSTATSWSVLTAIDTPEPASAEAADEFAAGEVVLETATTPEDLREAIAHFDRAIELRPTFARAYLDRSTATFAAGTQHAGQYLTIADPASITASNADLAKAYELGLRDSRVVGGLGHGYFLKGLETDDAALFDEAIRLAREAIGINPQEPSFRFNLALALLASGRTDEAKAAYEEAALHAVYADVEERRVRPGGQFVLSGALTDLNLLEEERPGLAETILATKEAIIGPVTAGTMETVTSDASAGGFEAQVFASEVQVRIDEIPNYDLDRDVISVQWYFHPQGQPWTSMPEVSGRSYPLEDVAAGIFFDLRSYLTLTFPPRCIEPGRYKVEVYMNGKLSGAAEVEAPFGSLTARTNPELNAVFCAPSDWGPAPDVRSGFSAGYASPDGESGGYVYRFDRGLQFLDPKRRTHTLLNILVKNIGLWPSKPVFYSTSVSDYFMGFEHSKVTFYSYEGGRIVAGTGYDQGSVVIAVVFGPGDYVDTTAGLGVFDSFAPYLF